MQKCVYELVYLGGARQVLEIKTPYQRDRNLPFPVNISQESALTFG